MTLPVTTFNSWIIRVNPGSKARLRLFCFPYAGGSASLFRSWERFRHAQVEVCAMQLPGRESRRQEVPFTQMRPLIKTLARQMSPYMDMPFTFFGHSLGALLCFELARQLRREEKPGPLYLWASACKAPQLPKTARALSQLSDEALVEELRLFHGTSEMVLQNEELIRIYLPLLRADFQLHETYLYSPQAPLSCSISAFGGIHDPDVSCGDLVAWQNQTTGSFTLQMFQGDHFFLKSAETILLQALRQELSFLIERLA